MSEDKTYNLNGKLSELVGALEVTTNKTAEIMLISAIKQTLVRDFGAVLDKDETQAPNDGWIEWSGGECPLPAGVEIDIKQRNGLIYKSNISGERRWTHMKNHYDIIAYRISK